MASLYIYEVGSPVKVVELPKMGRFSIGRNSRAKLLLPDKSVSRRHATMELVGDGWVVEDRGAINNLFVNSQPIDEATLQDGDEIQIGHYLIIFHAESTGDTKFSEFTSGQKITKYHVPKSLASDAEQTTIIKPEELARVRDVIRAQDRALVRVAGGKQAWRPGREQLTFGGKEGRVPCEGFGMGSTFAELKWSGSAHMVAKTGMLVGVKVNGNAVKDERALRDGDIITVGKSEFEYVVK